MDNNFIELFKKMNPKFKRWLFIQKVKLFFSLNKVYYYMYHENGGFKKFVRVYSKRRPSNAGYIKRMDGGWPCQYYDDWRKGFSEEIEEIGWRDLSAYTYLGCKKEFELM